MARESGFFTVYDWMAEELHLTGNELLVYALVASYPDGYYASYAKTAERIGLSRRNTYPIFKKLVEKGLLSETGEAGMRTKKYTAIGIKHPSDRDKTSLTIGIKHPSDRDKTSPNNIIIDNIDIDNYRDIAHEKKSEPKKERGKTTATISEEAQEKAKKEKSCAKKEKPFQKPTIEEVAAYIREKGWQVNPEHWLSHYESNGWMVGGSPMRDWKAAVKTWQYNGINRQPKAQNYDSRKFARRHDNYPDCSTIR